MKHQAWHVSSDLGRGFVWPLSALCCGPWFLRVFHAFRSGGAWRCWWEEGLQWGITYNGERAWRPCDSRHWKLKIPPAIIRWSQLAWEKSDSYMTKLLEMGNYLILGRVMICKSGAESRLLFHDSPGPGHNLHSPVRPAYTVGVPRTRRF